MADALLTDYAVHLRPTDNVAVARKPIPAGFALQHDGGTLTLPAAVRLGHKFAVQPIKEGDPIQKYGQVIGFAGHAIGLGEHVHTHNVVLGKFDRDYAYATQTPPPPAPPAEYRTFEGYDRGPGRQPHQRYGTRNYIAVISTVNCSAATSKYIAERIRALDLLKDYPHVDGIVPIIHKHGCAMAYDGEDHNQLDLTLAGFANHPNVAAYILVGLGCETGQATHLIEHQHLNLQQLGRPKDKPLVLSIQESGGIGKTVDLGVKAVAELLPKANDIRRTTISAKHILLGTNCGGSDGNSGVTANPALGVASDMIVQQGGTTVLGETPEIYGAEHLLTRRAVSKEVGEKLVERIKWWEWYTSVFGVEINNNPSVGNKEGGLTTIYEKSLGAVAKAGTTAMVDVVRYAEPVRAKGFVVMDTPGYDPVSMTGIVAGGANVCVFTTGRGSVYGCKPAPCIKVATNTPLYDRMLSDMDIDAGTVLAGVPVEEVGQQIFEEILTVASGKKTKSELHGVGEDEFSPWHIGPTLTIFAEPHLTVNARPLTVYPAATLRYTKRMSYRGFKRLLGETGLERKTRNLLGCGVIVLMTASFVVYARETEDLAYDQLQNTGRTLIPGVLARTHLAGPERDRLDQQQKLAEESLPTPPTAYRYRLITPNAVRPENQPTTDEAPFLAAFLEDPAETWKDDKRRNEQAYIYYGAVRAVPACIQCHSTDKVPRPLPDLKPGDLMAVVSVRMSTDLIESGFHQNRALLIAFAIGTTVLILAGSYLIIRYVIVKPVRHLKEVSEAIAAGELNVRSEIQTGDEFEDLSLAFNRMLRNLTTMSDRNRQLLDDQKHKLDELARLNMALHQSDTLKGSFLSTMSHELRTPLNSIIGFSEVLLNAENLTPKQHRYAANIMTSGQQLLALINDVLDLAKMESGRMRLHPEDLKPFEVCEQALTLFRDAAEKKNVELRLTASPDLPVIRQDAGKLHQILTNLISNSVKFTPQGGRIALGAEVAEGKLVLVISDTGVGIAPEEQETIFDKFRQSANTLTREQGGTGLGLSIVRELAKLLGGDVALKSDLGLGSTFTVTVTADLKSDPLLVFDLPDPA